MPFESRAQQGYLESEAAQGKIDPAVVQEYEKATTPEDYATMPERVNPKKGGHKADGPGGSHHGILATHHAKMGQHYKAKGQLRLADAHKNLAIAHAQVAESDSEGPAVAQRAQAAMKKRAPKESV